MICFAARGVGIHCPLCGRFRDMGTECRGYMPWRFWKPGRGAEGIPSQDRSLPEWIGSIFGQKGALVFIDVAGTVTEATAPYVRDKMTDPPVVAADETGHFCVPLLSDHVGRANELVEKMADWLNGIPVITTAANVNDVFIADIFAVRNGLCTIDKKEAREISAWLLDGGEMGFSCDSKYHGAEGAKDICRHSMCMNRMCGHDIWITSRNSEGPSFLRLVPKMVVVGVGCREGTPPDVLERHVLETLEDSGIDPATVKALSTIDIKAGEAAVSQLAGRYGWELRTFTAGELLVVKGEFEESGFVRTAVGTGNVYEGSCTAREGILLIHERAGEGVTVTATTEPVTRTGHSQQQPVAGKLDIEKCSRV